MDLSAPIWRKSTHSGATEGSHCVEVASFPHAVAVRDSKDPNGPFLLVGRESARMLSEQIKNS
ncbi:DUF397 domain-containing protein [Actinomadura kijaniata]|uniref:DUF397 domain-containing protein n=1 Tax=Actinomadura kijaniata TaxID=46161 RepID=UPI00082BB861|nr:DUF397 domain-containing protein [Actinomadura kijaniata]